MRTSVYIDGFNLYYRMLKNRPSVKWLNPMALVSHILSPSHNILNINYYTARLSSRADDPHAPARQAVYLKALSSVPQIVVHQGSFMVSKPWMPLANPPRLEWSVSISIRKPVSVASSKKNAIRWIDKVCTKRSATECNIASNSVCDPNSRANSFKLRRESYLSL